MITVITNDGEEDEYPITLTFNEVLFRVEIPMKQGYQLDLSVSDFNLLIGYEGWKCSWSIYPKFIIYSKFKSRQRIDKY